MYKKYSDGCQTKASQCKPRDSQESLFYLDIQDPVADYINRRPAEKHRYHDLF